MDNKYEEFLEKLREACEATVATVKVVAETIVTQVGATLESIANIESMVEEQRKKNEAKANPPTEPEPDQP